MSVASDMASITTGFNAKPVVFGAESTRGRLHEKDVVVTDDFGGQVLKRVTVLHVAVARLASAVLGDTLTVDGVTYTVRDNRRIAGGSIRELVLAT